MQCVAVIISNTLLYDIILSINCYSFLVIKNPLDLILAPSKGGDAMCTYT